MVDALTSQRDPEIRELIVKSGFQGNPDDQNDHGMTALMLATQGGHEEIVDVLLSYGVEVNCQNNRGNTALSLALQLGERNIARKLLGVASIDVDTYNSNMDSPLCLAAMAYLDVDIDLVKMLLGRSKIGPHSHARTCLPDCDQSFFRESQSRLEDNAVLKTPLTKAIVYGTTEVVEAMLGSPLIAPDVGSSSQSLFHSLSGGEEQDVRFRNIQVVLHDGKFPLDTKNMNGNTPLAKAARNGDWPLLEILVASGEVTIDSVNDDGYTPLMEAIYAPIQQPLIVYSLLQTNQVDVWKTTSLGSSALTLAQAIAASDDSKTTDIARRRKVVFDLVTAYAENRPLEVADVYYPDGADELPDSQSEAREDPPDSLSDIDLLEDEAATIFKINEMFEDYEPAFVHKVLRELYPRRAMDGSESEEDKH